jgi:MFS family permease
VAGLISPALARIILNIYVPSVLMGFGLGMLLPTLPILARSFGVAPEVAAQAVTALLIGRTASLFPCGYVVAPDARGSVQAFRRSVGEVGWRRHNRSATVPTIVTSLT